MTTPSEHINTAKNLAKLVEDNPLVKRAYIDDWGRHSNFTLIVFPEEHDRTTTTKLKGIVRRACNLRRDTHLRDCFPPEPQYKRDSFDGRKRLAGYHADFWEFDIDFHHYDPETNSFY